MLGLVCIGVNLVSSNSTVATFVWPRIQSTGHKPPFYTECPFLNERFLFLRAKLINLQFSPQFKYRKPWSNTIRGQVQ